MSIVGKSILALIGIVIIGTAAFVLWGTSAPVAVPIVDFDSCTAAGNPVLESYPRACTTQTGETFVEEIGNELEKQNLIKVTQPRPGSFIGSPLTIAGEARGTWFFEASFPIILTDETGNVIGTGIAQAQGEWMTEDFVPFTATVSFDLGVKANTQGTLHFKKDNPSGLLQYDDELLMPVRWNMPIDDNE